MSNPFARMGASASLLLLNAVAVAQTAPTDQPAPRKVETVTVTASPLAPAPAEMVQPATVLTDDDLRRRQSASIGDTVASEPGVHSSSFGPGAGRPIIRGLEGARVRVLQSGIDTLDASSISPDHKVAGESLSARQVEILRGPASLLYGSGAVGGIVNIVSGLIPTEVPEKPTGSYDFRGGSANRERTGAFDATAGGSGLAANANAFTRRTRDYDSPAGTIANSDVDEKGGGIGASIVGARGHLGAGVSVLESNYGIPSPEASRIDLERTRWDFAGELRDPGGPFTAAKFRAGYNDYEHREIESSGEVATVFRNKAWDARFEALHGEKDGKGALGMQFQDRDFSALGEEAIVPATKARAYALFGVQQWRFEHWTLEGGLRFEREDRRPEGGAPDRKYSLASGSAGAILKLADGIELVANFTHGERAPSIEELYSNGPHHATETFDLGNPRLGKERTDNLDLTLRGKSGRMSWKVNLFANRARDFVYQAAVDSDGDGAADRVDGEGNLAADGEFLVQNATAADARFRGVEAEWRHRPEGDGLGVRLWGDYVRSQLASGDNLPRIPPGRIGAELELRSGSWNGWVSATWVAKQSKVAPLETPTAGYTRMDAEVTYALERTSLGKLTLYVQGTNLLDEVMRVHTSYLKDFAPLMGRSFVGGVRGEF